jgi:hypothetical protein
MRIKLGVYEPGKANPSRFDRASTLEEFVAILQKLNPGDETILIVHQDDGRQVGCVSNLNVPTDKPTLYQELYNAMVDLMRPDEFKPDWLTPEQVALVNAKADEIIAKHERV